MNTPTSRLHRAAATALVALAAALPAVAGDGSGAVFTIELHLATLPQELRLCDEPDNIYFRNAALEDVSVADYSFIAESSGLSIYVVSAAPVLPCFTYTVPTTAALSAGVRRLADGSHVPSELSFDFERATLAVSIDAAHLTPAELAGVYRVSTLGYYQILDGGGTTEVRDFAPDLAFPAQGQGEFSVTDAAADFVPAAATSFPPQSWIEAHGFLDLLGVRVQQGATAMAIGPSITGAWYDPAQSGHGLMVEVLDGNRFLATWFAFTPDGGQQAWFLGVGTYSGDTATITAVAQPAGGRWIPNFDPARVVMQPWGSLTFTFDDCNHGRVQFDSIAGFGSGSMNLTRLTLPAGLSCPLGTTAGDAR